MEQITIGKEGNQPFVIAADGVSREHARITIDNEQWILEDLNSTNGTFILDDNGRMRQVVKVNINPMTHIYLGPQTAQGISFYAHQVKTPGKFYDDFNLMAVKNTEKQEKKRRNKNLLWYIKVGMLILNALLLILMSDMRMLFFFILPQLVTLIFDMGGRNERLEKRYKRFFDCPNPCCSNTLSEGEVEKRECIRCKNKIMQKK